MPGRQTAIGIAAAAALLAAGGARGAGAQSAPTVSIQLEREVVAVGETFDAYLAVEDAVNLSGFDTTITYDESFLSLTSVEISTAFLESGGRIVIPLGPVRSPGKVELGAQSIPGSGEAGADGGGDLAALTFRALAPGATTIGVGQVHLVDVPGTQWTVDGQGATVEIVPLGATPTPGGTPAPPTPTATPTTNARIFMPFLSRRKS